VRDRADGHDRGGGSADSLGSPSIRFSDHGRMVARIAHNEATMMSLSASAFRWLPVASAAASLAIIGLAVVGLAGIGNQTGDQAMGDKYVELLQAVRSPALHRVEMFLVWRAG